MINYTSIIYHDYLYIAVALPRRDRLLPHFLEKQIEMCKQFLKRWDDENNQKLHNLPLLSHEISSSSSSL